LHAATLLDARALRYAGPSTAAPLDRRYGHVVRAVVVTEPGPPEVLQVQTVPDPAPAAGEVLIRVAATAVNRADLLQREGNYPPPRGAAPYLGLECSGTIAELGADVAGWQVGDEVCALLSGGGYAELATAPAGQVLPVPDGISLVDAAALPEVCCTVWSMVFGARAGRLQPGERILVHGGSSGIGTMAIQLAVNHGAAVFTTVGTRRKAEACRALGAHVAINYRDEVFDDRIEAETAGAGVDVVLDNMGAVYLARNLRALAVGGRLILLGMQGGTKAEINLATLLANRATVHAAGLRARPAVEKAAIVAETQRAVWPALAAGAVHPVIDRVLTLDDAVEAHRLVESSEHIGKVLMRV
jgi:putative PIG3 family NAD(P)H quinone oxidoreductase